MSEKKPDNRMRRLSPLRTVAPALRQWSAIPAVDDAAVGPAAERLSDWSTAVIAKQWDALTASVGTAGFFAKEAGEYLEAN
jgi:hypothetical protein